MNCTARAVLPRVPQLNWAFHASWIVGFAAFALLCVGCSGRPGRVSTPNVDPVEAAEAAFGELDRDLDGQLNGSELKASPPLVDALAVYDANKDGSLTKEELAAGIGSWSKRGIGAMALPFTVRLNRRPLGGAEVKLVPAPFLGGAVKPARGTADETGSGSLEMAAEDRPANAPQHLPVMQPGLYLVEITHPSIELPAKYNTATTLGLEAGVAGQNPEGVTWDLKTP